MAYLKALEKTLEKKSGLVTTIFPVSLVTLQSSLISLLIPTELWNGSTLVQSSYGDERTKCGVGVDCSWGYLAS